MSPPIRYQADKICISRASCRLRVFFEFPFTCFFVLVGSNQSDEQSSKTKIDPRSFAIVQKPSDTVMTYISGCSRPKPMTCLQSYLKPEKIMLIVKLGNSKMQAVNGVSMFHVSLHLRLWPLAERARWGCGGQAFDDCDFQYARIFSILTHPCSFWFIVTLIVFVPFFWKQR